MIVVYLASCVSALRVPDNVSRAYDNTQLFGFGTPLMLRKFVFPGERWKDALLFYPPLLIHLNIFHLINRWLSLFLSCTDTEPNNNTRALVLFAHNMVTISFAVSTGRQPRDRSDSPLALAPDSRPYAIRTQEPISPNTFPRWILSHLIQAHANYTSWNTFFLYSSSLFSFPHRLPLFQC